LLGGLWHGASLRFVLWGALHGMALAIHKAFSEFIGPWKINSTVSGLLGTIITFHFVCFCWIFFRAPDMTIAGQVLTQIFTQFSLHVLPEFMVGYKAVIFLLIAGYTFHFLPKSTEIKAEQLVVRAPLAIKTLLLVLMIVLVIQTKSAGIQPFIYFQF
jgi:alginate O-acetyltransferase complex protein AlgI